MAVFYSEDCTCGCCTHIS